MPTPVHSSHSLLSERMAGVLWVVFAGFMFSLNAVLVRLGGHTIAITELIFYRYIIGFSILALVMFKKGISWKSQHKKRLFYRGTSGILSTTSYYIALINIPLAVTSTLSNTTGLFLCLLGFLFLGERPKASRIGALLLGLLGIRLVLKADFQLLNTLGVIAALLNGFFSALSYFNIRELHEAGEPEERIMAYVFVISLLYSGGWLLFTQGFHFLSLSALPYILGIGFTGIVAQWAITRAYKQGDISITSVFSYFGTTFFVVWDWYLWAFQPSFWMLIGMLCITVSGIWVSKR